MMWSGSDDPKDWRYKRRHTVLGSLHQMKQRYWNEYLDRRAAVEEVMDDGD